MTEERKTLKFRGGIGMSLIPVGIYVAFCMVLFIGFKAFNMEALAAGGFSGASGGRHILHQLQRVLGERDRDSGFLTDVPCLWL